MQKEKSIALGVVIFIGLAVIGLNLFRPSFAQTDASVTPLTPGWGGPNYDQPLWTVTYDKAIIPVSFTYYNCTSAALVLEYATWADYTKLDWQTGATGQYTGFIPASASDLSQKVYITIPNLIPSTSYIFRVGAKCTSSSPMGSLAYTTSANQFSTPAAPVITYSGSAVFQYGDAGGSIENNTLLTQKVINLRNTGSNADTFRTMLPINPETRCGLKSDQASSYPSNVMPNTLPASVDVPLGVNETKYIVAVCVTKGLTPGPFTWSYKTVSVGALNANRADVNPLIAEVQDTVNVTEPIPCTDSDNGMNTSIKGTATGTYAGARSGYIAIYGQEPDPNTPKPTTNKFSTYIDHCSWDPTQLNEGFCDASGRLQAIGIKCADGCKDGVCLPAPVPPSQPAPSASPIGHWKFDGNGNNEIAGGPSAAIVGNANFKTEGGKMNGYAYIPTSSDWLKIPYNAMFDLPDAFTVEFWFRQRSDQPFLQDLVYKGTPTNNYNFRIFRQLWNQYNFGPVITGYTAVKTGYWSQTSNGNVLTHGAWHHVAYTKDANGSAYYLDGLLIHALDTTRYTEYSGSAKTPPVDIIIGDSAVDTDIDDLKIYNRALSVEEILKETGFPLPAAPSNLAATVASNGTDVQLMWTDNSTNESKFLIYRRIAGSSSWESRGATGNNITSYMEPSVPAGAYEYKVTALYWTSDLQVSESLPSNIAAVTVGGVSAVGSTTLPGSSTPSLFPPPSFFPPPTSTLPTPGIPGLASQLPPPPSAPPPFSLQPIIGSGTTTPIMPPAAVAITPTDASFQCKPYLHGIQQGIAADKQFWREVNWKLNEAKATYSGAQEVSDLLTQSKTAITAVDRIVKRGKCDEVALDSLQKQTEKLRGEIFAELNTHFFEMEDIAAINQCRAKLDGLNSKTKRMLAMRPDDEQKNLLENFASRITQKSAEIQQKAGDTDFDVEADCESFAGEFDEELDAVRSQFHPDIDKTSEKVLEQLGNYTDALSQSLAKNQKNVEELAVQVAELRKTLDGVTKTAGELSEKVVVSYQALARMKDVFEEERTKILAEKDKLTMLVEEAARVLEETGCGRGVDRSQMSAVLGKAATVNWIGDRAGDIEKKLQTIMSACRSKDFTREDLISFSANINETEGANLAESYQRGYTPFADVPTHEWYYGGMLTAYENGYMTKGLPGENALAQDALLMILRAAGIENITGECELKASGISKVSPYAICAVNAANGKGLVLQRDMTKPVERIRIAEWISALEPSLPKQADAKTDVSSFADIRSLGDAKRFVAYMYVNEIMVGRVLPDGKTRYFDPAAPLTRAALAVVLEKLHNIVLSQQH